MVSNDGDPQLIKFVILKGCSLSKRSYPLISCQAPFLLQPTLLVPKRQYGYQKTKIKKEAGGTSREKVKIRRFDRHVRVHERKDE